MLIKIIKDNCYNNDSNINISKYLGKTFYAERTNYNTRNSVEANMGEDVGILTIFDGEYEIVME